MLRFRLGCTLQEWMQSHLQQSVSHSDNYMNTANKCDAGHESVTLDWGGANQAQNPD